ncbi:hypothetical protein [Anaerobium acetethylicum]|uniref:hypothetical protein n=1 Tax=Anaerobium acetethylicum TaxID=1619234 RepID=UPI001470C048|nr:hypothetical protein [Anaerobium acetethylicum]
MDAENAGFKGHAERDFPPSYPCHGWKTMIEYMTVMKHSNWDVYIERNIMRRKGVLLCQDIQSSPT